MIALQEYDLEFKTTNIMKGQGLCNMVIDALDLERQPK